MITLLDPSTVIGALCASALLATRIRTTNPARKPSPTEALAKLEEGNRRFAAGKAIHPHTDSRRLAQAATEEQGDHAYATIITCSDSRIPVERIFDAGIMDLFVIRVAGNVCTGNEIGSMEYGLVHVRTPLLVILGHTGCRAVTAGVKTVQFRAGALERNIPRLIEPIKSAVLRAMELNPGLLDDAIIPAAIEENVWHGIENVFRESPAIRDLVNRGTAKIVGALYDVGTGQVRWLEESRVSEILRKVEADPNRPVNPWAEGS